MREHRSAAVFDDERWSTLIDDLRIVAGHLFLPSDMTKSLPPIDSSWSNFSGGETSEFDITTLFQEAAYEVGRLSPIKEFVDSIERTEGEPTLFYMHALLPHVPWEYLPTGQKFIDLVRGSGSVSPGWGATNGLSTRPTSVTFFQVGYVDNVVGQVIDRLESQGMYDDALVVIAAITASRSARTSITDARQPRKRSATSLPSPCS